MSINERKCLNVKCGHIADYRVAGNSGNSRVAFTTDGTDPSEILPKGRRGRYNSYSNRVRR